MYISWALVAAWLFAPTAAVAANECWAEYDKVIGIEEVNAIRSGPLPQILIDDETLNDWENVQLTVYLDDNGRVICMVPMFGPARLLPQALALARQWKFKPYILNGKPIPVSFGQRIDVRWKSPRPNVRTPFPAIRDKSTLRIRLDVQPGYMSCTAYAIELSGDGMLIFEGDYGAAGRERQIKRLPPDTVDALVSQFRKAEFFWLHESYTGKTQDAPTLEVSIAFDEHKKLLRDDVGREAGMPAGVTVIEREIERLAEAERLTARVRCRFD
ncbi:MAG: DUF6438 domain-containing protein [Micropepsaceae bacterium]